MTTLICLLAVFVVPFTAAYIRLLPVPDDAWLNLNGVIQLDQLTAPQSLPFAQLNAAAAFANAATVYGVNPPQLTLFNGAISWTVAAVVRISSRFVPEPIFRTVINWTRYAYPR